LSSSRFSHSKPAEWQCWCAKSMQNSMGTGAMFNYQSLTELICVVRVLIFLEFPKSPCLHSPPANSPLPPPQQREQSCLTCNTPCGISYSSEGCIPGVITVSKYTVVLVFDKGVGETKFRCKIMALPYGFPCV
jgi:hypothetical protein